METLVLLHFMCMQVLSPMVLKTMMTFWVFCLSSSILLSSYLCSNMCSLSYGLTTMAMVCNTLNSSHLPQFYFWVIWMGLVILVFEFLKYLILVLKIHDSLHFSLFFDRDVYWHRALIKGLTCNELWIFRDQNDKVHMF